MDTSETYIKMCDCPEVRNLINKIIESSYQNKIKTSERFMDTQYSVRIPDCGTPDVLIFNRKTGDILRRVDLLSQDQIQEMMGEPDFPHLIRSFYRFWDENWDKEVVKRVGSMEQFWLAFYMHEKHSKVWDGEKWAKK